MKYALIFIATAAAHEAYGGYGAHPVHEKPSAVVESSSSMKPTGYTTIVPGYGKEPVTVTTQHQHYPTCVAAGYGGNDCAKWDEEVYVSTVIKDYDNNYATITKTEQPVTVYHTKKTITHSATPTVGYAAPTGYPAKNGTWYELYEKIEEVPYKNLGPHALPGYPGSGLYKGDEKKQPVLVKEYKGGKWSQYDHERSYGTPEAEVSTFEKPGVYTVPSKDVTVEHPVTYPAEATKTAKAGETCTYGGQYVDAKETGYVTGAYGAYETKVEGGKTVTETVVKYTTIFASTTGQYEVAKPTTAVYDHDTEIKYPTAKHYDAGVYHHDAKTVTVTKGGQAYTCEYEQTKKYEATATPKGEEYPAHPTGTPKKPVEGEGKHGGYPGKPTEGEHPAYPGKPTEGEGKHPAYPGKPTEGESDKPSYPKHPTEGEKEYPSYPGKPTEGESDKPSYPGKPTEGENEHPSYPGHPTEGEKEYPSHPKNPTEGDHSSYPVSVMSSPAVHESYPASTPVAASSKPSYNGDNGYGNNPKPTPSMTSVYVPAIPSSVHPEAATSTPCESSATPVVPTAHKPETYVVPTPTPEVETPTHETYGPKTPTQEVHQPETYEPKTPTPETYKPETPAPETHEPKTPEPEVYEPKTPEPEVYEPKTPTPEVHQPESEDNKYEAPGQGYGAYAKRNVKAKRDFIL